MPIQSAPHVGHQDDICARAQKKRLVRPFSEIAPVVFVHFETAVDTVRPRDCPGAISFPACRSLLGRAGNSLMLRRRSWGARQRRKRIQLAALRTLHYLYPLAPRFRHVQWLLAAPTVHAVAFLSLSLSLSLLRSCNRR